MYNDDKKHPKRRILIQCPKEMKTRPFSYMQRKRMYGWSGPSHTLNQDVEKKGIQKSRERLILV